MIVVIAVVAIVAVGLAAALAFGGVSRMSVHAPDPVSSVGGRPLPAGEFTGDDVADLRFDMAVRGYRMEQVDDAVERLRDRIHDLEDELAGRERGLPTHLEAAPHLSPAGGEDVPGPGFGPAQGHRAGHGDSPLS